MELIEQIKQIVDTLPPGERLVAEYILQYPFDAVRFGSATLADYAGTSRSNVVRFSQKMGFAGFTEFKYELNRCMKETQQVTIVERPSEGETVLQKYLTGLGKMEALYHSSQIDEIAKLLVQSRRVVVLGRFHSALSAQQLAFRLNRSMVDAYAISDPSIMEAYGDILTDQDVIVIFSNQARKDFYQVLLETCRPRGVKSVLITVTQRPALAQYVDHVVVLPAIAREYSNDMLDDSPTFFLFIELLLEAVAKQSNINKLNSPCEEGGKQ